MTRGTLVGTTSRQAPFSLPPEWKLHFRLGLFKSDVFLRDKDWAQVVKTNHYLSHHYLSLEGKFEEACERTSQANQRSR